MRLRSQKGLHVQRPFGIPEKPSPTQGKRVPMQIRSALASHKRIDHSRSAVDNAETASVFRKRLGEFLIRFFPNRFQNSTPAKSER